MYIIVIDDHPLFCNGVVQMVRTACPQIEVECASSAEQGLGLARRGADLILLDLSLPGLEGSEAFAMLRRQCPDVPIAILTASDNRHDMEAAMAAGARAFLRKSDPPEELLNAILRILAGETVCSDKSHNALPAGLPVHLTPRQREILHLLCRGHPNKEIALQLGLAETTVKTHITAIFQALGVVNRTQAVLAVRRHGWVAFNPADDSV